MLHEFLTTNRIELIDRCRLKAVQRTAPKAMELEHGIPLFLDQLIKTLRVEQTHAPKRNHEVSGKPCSERPGSTEISASAGLHGRELLEQGFTVDQVVHAYGDLCQAVTEMAFEDGAAIEVDELGTLNRCLDNAIADAVLEFSYIHQSLMTDRGQQAWNEHVGFLAHEMRDLINTATLAVAAIKTGRAAINGTTGAVLDRSLKRMSNLIDRSFADVRVTAGMPAQHQRISLADFVADVNGSASLEARARGCKFSVSDIEKGLAVDVDRDTLLSAVANLLQNAFKFTKPRTEVSLNAYAVADRILIDVVDHCGGLPPGGAEKMFLPFTQNGADKSDLGLGLSMCRRGVEANNGLLRVRDMPGTGCVFTIDLPRHLLPQSSRLSRYPYS